MRATLVMILVACSGGSDAPGTRIGTTVADDGSDADYDGVADLWDCDPDDASVYPGAPDAPEDGVDSDCDGKDPTYEWRGDWEVTDVQAIYSTYPILVPGGADGELSIGDDGDVGLDAEALLDPSLTGVPFDVFAGLDFGGHAAPQARADQLMLYVDGGVVVPGLGEEVSYADLLCTVDGDAMHCKGTLKALDITLDTEAWFER